MGYESRLYVVNKFGVVDEENKMKLAEVVAVFNMCVCPTTYILKDSKKTDCYFYNNDEIVLKDRYEKPLTEATIEEVISLLETDINNGENYRRLFPLLATLKIFKEQKNIGAWDDDLVVLHYGY